MKKPIKKAPRSGNREASRRVQDRNKKQSTSGAKPQEKKAKAPPKASRKTAAQKRAELETRRKRARAARLGWERRRKAGAQKSAEKKREELQAQRIRELEAWQKQREQSNQRFQQYKKDLKASRREWLKVWRAAVRHAVQQLGSSRNFSLQGVKNRLKAQTFPFCQFYPTYSRRELLDFAQEQVIDGEINPFWYH